MCKEGDKKSLFCARIPSWEEAAAAAAAEATSLTFQLSHL